MEKAHTISATESKATCLSLLDAVAARRIEAVSSTKRGQVVAVLYPPPAAADAAATLHGCLRGTVEVPDDVDLTAPVLDEPLDAEHGRFGA